MLTINANTRIAEIFKQHPAALEAIVSLSPKFSKLRNPFLRKLMAGRTSLAMASKIGGCTVADFFQKLKPLGFDIDQKEDIEEEHGNRSMPAFLRQLPADCLVELDVRPLFKDGDDPLKIILATIAALKQGQVLKLTTGFEPVPLILLLEKKGFESFVVNQQENLVITFFYNKKQEKMAALPPETVAKDWDEIYSCFEGNLQTIDVRQLEMPKPMLAILEALENLPAGKALLVMHKRLPVYLLPELRERNMDYRVKESSPNEVQLLIYRA